MTVLDTSGAVAFLLDQPSAPVVERLFAEEGELTAPDVLVFEALAVLRRITLHGDLEERRAQGAIEDLGELPIRLYASTPLRSRAWELRSNFSAADALFVALAERLGSPLASIDASLLSALGGVEGVDVATIRL